MLVQITSTTSTKTVLRHEIKQVHVQAVQVFSLNENYHPGWLEVRALQFWRAQILKAKQSKSSCPEQSFEAASNKLRPIKTALTPVQIKELAGHLRHNRLSQRSRREKSPASREPKKLTQSTAT
jgi:hypothetical protein